LLDAAKVSKFTLSCYWKNRTVDFQVSHLSQLHYAYGKPSATAVIRRHPEDFKVSEQLSFSPDGKGQHVFLLLEKCSLNTDDVSTSLARFANVKQVAIGYAGLKDKHAVARQWFSVDLAGQPEPDWHELESDSIKVLEVMRHGRKLKRGAVAKNTFEIMLREFEGNSGNLEERLVNIMERGVPNYFGEQRFGYNESNLKKAEELAKNPQKKIKRHMRSIYLSSVRSFLFNQVLSQRVSDNSWDSPLAGDVFMLDGSHSIFSPEQIDDEIKRRVTENDIHPTGPMWGAGELIPQLEVLELEKQLASDYPQWCAFLEKAGLKQERRALRLPVDGLEWQWEEDCLLLKFGLASGCYATSVLRELITC